MIKDRDSWETPKELWNKLNEQYNNRYYEIFEDCDFIHDNLVCWMNPPFSKAYTMFEHFFKVINKGVAIYRCDYMETKVWQKIILPNSSWIFIFNKRIQYEGQEGKGSRFPSALFGFNVPPPKLTNGVLLI